MQGIYKRLPNDISSLLLIPVIVIRNSECLARITRAILCWLKMLFNKYDDPSHINWVCIVNWTNKDSKDMTFYNILSFAVDHFVLAKRRFFLWLLNFDCWADVVRAINHSEVLILIDSTCVLWLGVSINSSQDDRSRQSGHKLLGCSNEQQWSSTILSPQQKETGDSWW